MTHVEVPVSIGWVCVFIAILAFGFFTTPLKMDCVKRSKVDPFMIQLFLSFPIFIFSLPVLAFSEFEFSFYGIWGSAIWVPVSILSIIGIHFLGIAIAQSLWCGLSILFSFLWGVFLFHQELRNLGLTLLGLSLLIIGIVGITLSDLDFFGMVCKKMGIRLCKKATRQKIEEDETLATTENEQQHQRENEHSQKIEAVVINNSDEEKEANLQISIDSKEHEKGKKIVAVLKYLVGIVSIFIMSALNGSLMVPAKLDSGNPLYFFSFGVGVLLFSSFYISIIYLLKTIITKKPPFTYQQVRDGAIPGTLVGIMFVFGNYAQTYASFSPLGLALGFPLVQTCMVLTALNGMVFFGELPNWRNKAQFFVCCIFLVVPGFFLVAGFGMA